MARIIKRNNGSFLIRVTCGRDYKGKQIIFNTTFKPTKTTPRAIEKEVQAFAQEYENKVRNGEVLIGESITFEEFSERWKSEWAFDHLTQGQVEQYCDTLERHILPKIGHMKLSSINALQIQSIVQEWKKTYKPETIRRHVTAMNSVFRFAYRLSVIKENPVDRVELPKLEKDTGVHCFSLEQSKAFLQFISEPFETVYKAHSRKHSNGTIYSVQEYTETHTVPYQFQVYFTLSIIGGFRRGELLALTWNDIDFENCTITVTKAISHTPHSGDVVKAPKTKSGNRCIIMPQHCIEMLRNLRTLEEEQSHSEKWKAKTGREFNSNYIFIQDNGLRMDTKTPSHKFKQIIKRYNSCVECEDDKLPEIRLHDLRHTSASLLIAEGCDVETVSHRLGHSKASITLNVYGHHLEAKDVEASKTLTHLFKAQETPEIGSERVPDSKLLSMINNLTPEQLEVLRRAIL